MSARHVSLSLSEGERERLAALGVVADARGVLHAAGGRPVSAGAAAALLKGADGEHPVRPGDFRRAYLEDGHQAPYAGGNVVGMPANTRDGRVVEAYGPDVDGPGASHRGAAKAETLDPESFRRGYLDRGHATQSPATTGARGVVNLPASHPAEPQRFDRPWLAGDALPSPDDGPANSPVLPGSPGAVVYARASADYETARAEDRAEHVGLTGHCDSFPAPARWEPPLDLGAAATLRPIAATPMGGAG